jgi:hypothetical protein
MNWVAIIMLLLQYGPAIVKLVMEIIALIKKTRSHDKEPELRESITHFKRTRDIEPLKRLRDELRRRRDGP